MKLLPAVFGVCLFASAAQADTPPQTPRKSDPNAIRCVRTPVTGYLALTKKICRTNRDWEQEQVNARDMQNRGLICSNGATCAGK